MYTCMHQWDMRTLVGQTVSKKKGHAFLGSDIRVPHLGRLRNGPVKGSGVARSDDDCANAAVEMEVIVEDVTESFALLILVTEW